jgi:hypothetical protein
MADITFQNCAEVEEAEFDSLKQADSLNVLKDSLEYFGRPSQEAESYSTFADELVEGSAKYLDPTWDEWVQTYDSIDDARIVMRQQTRDALNKPVSENSSIKKVYTAIRYPLSRPARFCYDITVEDSNPLTVGHLLYIYTLAYQMVYALEEEEEGDPGHIPGMLNRSKSDGPFGIWGHDIEDLVYNGGSTIEVYDGYVICDFDCDS